MPFPVAVVFAAVLAVGVVQAVRKRSWWGVAPALLVILWLSLSWLVQR